MTRSLMLAVAVLVTAATARSAQAETTPTHRQVWRAIARSREPIAPLAGYRCSERHRTLGGFAACVRRSFTCPGHPPALETTCRADEAAGGWACETAISEAEIPARQCGGAVHIRLRFVRGKIVPGSVSFSVSG